ncbi:MAG TPA: T9SS type A sorting domain-containing protein [Bacteroidia bacterium]|nr:T9SS type A sorting domain-containing protein [Bacteroidia bacterium]
MKRFYTAIFTLALLLALHLGAKAQVQCSPNGNLFVYANYDGGILNIDVNVNIPNIKIGICTYEPTTINITGAFVGNVTEVRYAGYVSTNNFHCNNSPSTTTITGVPGNITSVLFLPPATLSNPNGYSSIVCAYSCTTTSNQGGCNTADQIRDYFQSTMGGSLTSYFTQYGCWSSQPYQLSTGGNCCNTVLPCNILADAGLNQQVCPGGSATLTGSATGGATTYSWSPTTGLGNPNSATTSAAPSVTTTYVLTASDGGICADQDTVVVTVLQPVATIPQFQDLCVDAPALTLAGGSPAGGTYSGTGVSSGVFDPAVAGVGTHTLTYTGTDGNGCTATTTGTITVHALPQVSAGQVGPFCTNDNSVLLASGIPSGGSYSGTGVNNGVFDPGNAGAGSHTLTYLYTDSNGCEASASSITVVNANPNAPVLSFVAPSLNAGGNADSVQWFFNGQYLLTNGTSINPTQNGLYSAIVWVNGCPSDTSAATLVELVGILDGSGALTFTAWPNPMSGNSLHVGANADLLFQVRVYDALGRLAAPAKEMLKTGDLEIKHLAKGIYFLHIQFDGGEEYLQLIKD